MPVCTKCDTDKLVEDLVVDRQKKLGYRHLCKICHVAYARRRYLANRKKVDDYVREWRRKNPGKRNATEKRWRLANYQHHLFTHTRNRARRSGIPFELTEDDFAIPGVCPVLGIPLRINVDPNRRPHDAPSIDKIIPGLGYVKGNTRVISSRANRIKDNGTAEEHRAIADYIERETRKQAA